jgi:DNA-directed RNA polymerase specialized sigma24 family protein
MMGATKRDQTKIERQFDGQYSLSTASGVKQLLGDYHAFKARQYLGDYEAVVVLADLAEAVRLAGLTDRQREAIELVYGEDLTQVEAGKRLGISQQAIDYYIAEATERIADIYYYWASHGEGYVVGERIEHSEMEETENDE